MEKSVESERERAVVDPDEIWSIGLLALLFFLGGIFSCVLTIGVCLIVLFLIPHIAGASRIAGPIFYGILVILELVVPLIVTSRHQSIIRTLPRSLVAAIAFVAGSLWLFGFSLFFGSWKTLRGLLLLTTLFSVIIAMINGLFFLVLNRIRPLKPIQDGTLCPQCAYSIIGNASGVCPECGCRELPSA